MVPSAVPPCPAARRAVRRGRAQPLPPIALPVTPGSAGRVRVAAEADRGVGRSRLPSPPRSWRRNVGPASRRPYSTQVGCGSRVAAALPLAVAVGALVPLGAAADGRRAVRAVAAVGALAGLDDVVADDRRPVSPPTPAAPARTAWSRGCGDPRASASMAARRRRSRRGHLGHRAGRAPEQKLALVASKPPDADAGGDVTASVGFAETQTAASPSRGDVDAARDRAAGCAARAGPRHAARASRDEDALARRRRRSRRSCRRRSSDRSDFRVRRLDEVFAAAAPVAGLPSRSQVPAGQVLGLRGAARPRRAAAADAAGTADVPRAPGCSRPAAPARPRRAQRRRARRVRGFAAAGVHVAARRTRTPQARS